MSCRRLARVMHSDGKHMTTRLLRCEATTIVSSYSEILETVLNKYLCVHLVKVHTCSVQRVQTGFSSLIWTAPTRPASLQPREVFITANLRTETGDHAIRPA